MMQRMTVAGMAAVFGVIATMAGFAEELPLIAFSSEPIAKMDKARMAEARDAGFTAVALVPKTAAQAVAALDAAQAASDP